MGSPYSKRRGLKLSSSTGLPVIIVVLSQFAGKAHIVTASHLFLLWGKHTLLSFRTNSSTAINQSFAASGKKTGGMCILPHMLVTYSLK